jgi:hypothetical protein
VLSAPLPLLVTIVEQAARCGIVGKTAQTHIGQSTIAVIEKDVLVNPGGAALNK